MSSSAYRVLARKYRPQAFDQLIGQDALVRTLKNAIAANRVAHAFMLTGIRGVGKTTTARIIARALNYTGPDGTSGPTSGPTDDCDICRAIAEDRHPDVMEMDAASRTGVDDIREVLDGVRYAPVSARFKIYIIDEVHMLSRNAFNALLKTLEEPPPHVKFIFATTEIRKVPVTVLSRCQRFDLRRVDAPLLSSYYKTICGKEGVEAEEDALTLIARAADGSVRDGLSLLDQAIALSDGTITGTIVRDMLGLADRGLILDLFNAVMDGRCDTALFIMDDLHKKGADPAVILGDLLEVTHRLTRIRAVPALGEAEDAPLRAMAAALSLPVLGRAWQILLKGMGEVQMAANPARAAEMVLIRLAYAADLPDPAELLRTLKDAPASSGEPAYRPAPRGNGGGAQALAAHAAPEPAIARPLPVSSIKGVVAMLQQSGAMMLAEQVRLFVRPVKVEDGRLEFQPADGAESTLAQDLSKGLFKASGKRWMVAVSSGGAPTLAEKEGMARNMARAAVLENPLVKEILTIFPDAEVRRIYKEDEET